jgi:hypothetical protein
MSVEVTYARLGDGTVRLESPDGEFLSIPIEDSIIYIGFLRQTMNWLGVEGIRFVARQTPSEEFEEDDGIGFEGDLDYLMAKNAELYRRLAG